MRLDKFLKVTQLIKRRALANTICSAGRVSVNGKPSKPGHQLKDGDVLVIGFGDKAITVKVLSVDEKLYKHGQSQKMFEVVD